MSYEGGLQGPPGTNGTNGATGATGMGYASGLATCPSGYVDYWIPISPPITGFDESAVVQALLQIPDDETQNWIVYSAPLLTLTNSQYIHVSFSFAVNNPNTTIAWNVVSLNKEPTVAGFINPNSIPPS
jgi:hypothetical protein